MVEGRRIREETTGEDCNGNWELGTGCWCLIHYKESTATQAEALQPTIHCSCREDA